MLNNQLQQENIRLRTKLNQLDREIGRRDDFIEDIRTEGNRGVNVGVQKTHLVSNLKQSVKDLRQDLRQKEEEITLLRRNLKSTKIGELEVEIQVYADECTRLRHHLEEMLRQREESPGQQSPKIDEMYQELEEMAQHLRAAQEDANRWRLKALDHHEKTRKPKKSGEAQQLRNELQKLRAHMDSLQEQSNRKIQEYEAALAKQKTATSTAQESLRRLEGALRDKTREVDNLQSSIAQTEVPKQERSLVEAAPSLEQLPPLLHKFFTRLHKVLQRKRILLAVFLSLMDKSNHGYIEVSELFKGLKLNKAGMKRSDLVEAVKLMGGANSISIKGIEAWHAKYNFVDNVSSDTSEEQSPNTSGPKAEEVKRTDQRKDRPTSAKVSHKQEVRSPPKLESNLGVIAEVPKQEKPSEKQSEQKPTQVLKASSPPKQVERTQQSFSTPPKPAQSDLREIPSFVKAEKRDQVEGKTKKASNGQSSTPVQSDVAEGEARPILQHIALRSQLHRLQKQEVGSIVAKSTKKSVLGLQDLKSLFLAEPFSLNDMQSDHIAKYLIKKATPKSLNEAPAKDVARALVDALENWTVLIEEDEQRYDQHISHLIAKNQVSMKEACKLQDDLSCGVIRFSDFKKATEDLELSFSEEELKYMQLLFYSHNYELDTVPYKQFIQAYSKMQEENQEFYDDDNFDEEESLDEETRAAIVRDKLEIISKALVHQKKSVAKAFINTDGLVYPQQLLETLRQLGIPDFEKEDFVVFMEGLQCEDEDELCISLEYLEELLAHYEVKIAHGRVSPAQGILYELESAKKVSLMDTPE
jgi:Ca2+-binding EF-hand superfamily protein